MDRFIMGLIVTGTIMLYVWTQKIRHYREAGEMRLAGPQLQ
jgi:hypothetical protein